ncbi:cell wall-associated NlpC family hydrolase [Friedmanniella endophytica]|uniref:Cell wall-associated NlpC family hydrolase n=1 Tax=Microlunatus kandeliicorticis TaxID=1759536 RepID=A0A7W3IU96_9ACTN|nr:C40 family peptidase [Microlunatus kandeliicorticis]MBA8795349.1 cell wall-associated NlpC family hydrolase [Microlunatus kandeliicorticis]
MSKREPGQPPRSPRARARRGVTLSLTLGVSLSLLLGSGPAALADPVIPSKSDVQKAQQAAAQKAQQVNAIEAQLAAAQAQLQTLQIREQAAEQKYIGAMADLAAAKAVLQARQADEKRALAAVALARTQVGEMARSAVQGNAGLLAWAPIFDGGSPQQVLDQAGSFNSYSTVLKGKFDQLKSAEAKAASAQAQAAAAQQVVQNAANAAAQAKQAAEAAAAAQSAAVAGYAGQRAALIRQLAEAQRVSVAIAKQRQDGLEAQARARRIAAAKAREAAMKRREEAAARAAAARQAAQERAEQRAEQRAKARSQQASSSSSGSSSSGSSGSSGSSSSSSGSSGSSGSSSSGGGYGGGYTSAGARKAIAYAYAQLGKPYVFGATGPYSFDCSGLTMRAWESAGVEIGHYTGIQWNNVQHISMSQLRPGDLVFWGSTSNPASIYHTAIYIGGGRIIQAPSPGNYVKISGIYDWITPNFFGRV